MSVIEFPGRQRQRDPAPDRTVPLLAKMITTCVMDAVTVAMEAEGIPFETRERITRRLLLTEREREASG